MTSQFTVQTPQFPDVCVRLVGEDGNAFAIMGRVILALRRAGHEDAVDAYLEKCKSGTYEELLHHTMCTVQCFATVEEGVIITVTHEEPIK